MSKRPKAAGSFLSRLRRPASRLRDMPIWSKLGLIMIVPTIATVVVGTTGLVDHLQTLNNANRAGDLANLIGYSGELIDTLQDERTAAVLLLSADTPQVKTSYTAAYDQVDKKVDHAKDRYSQQRAKLNDLPATLDNLLGGIDQDLTDLPGTRSQVINGKMATSQAIRVYEGLISDLLAVRDSSTQLAGDSDLSDRMRAAAAIARTKEFLSERRVVVHRALASKPKSSARACARTTSPASPPSGRRRRPSPPSPTAQRPSSTSRPSPGATCARCSPTRARSSATRPVTCRPSPSVRTSGTPRWSATPS